MSGSTYTRVWLVLSKTEYRTNKSQGPHAGAIQDNWQKPFDHRAVSASSTQGQQPCHSALWLHVPSANLLPQKHAAELGFLLCVTTDSGRTAVVAYWLLHLKILIALSSEWTQCYAWYLVMRGEVKHKLTGKEICIIHWEFRKHHHISKVHTANYKIIFHLLAQIV